jgi:hypothetical protein
MTFDEIREIPDLQIDVTDVVEDCFYYKMFLLGRISLEAGMKAEERLMFKYTQKELENAFALADRMIDNIDKYGVAAASMV